MPDKPASERTEQPTTKRLLKAKTEGQIPQSQELTSFMSILILVAMVTFLAPSLTRWCIKQLQQGMVCDTSPFAGSKAFLSFINDKIASLMILSLPIYAALCVGAIVGNIVVAGLNYSPKAIRLNLGAVSPVKGFGKLVNMRSMVRLIASIFKLIFVSAISWYYLQDKLDTIAALRWAWSFALLAAIAKLILGLMIRICIALLIIALADTAFQKWKHIQDLKMTKQQVKEERRQTEGSPEVRGRIRRIQIEMAMKRMLQEVPKATVVLTNPTHVAVALRYDAKAGQAPVLLAKGADHMAEKIREIARAYGVPIIRRPELARTIYSTVELNATIPETLYVAVAEVLAMIYRLRHRR
ncbi:MAG: flagellar biosynthesis protein FlhB [Sedimentisphaerales bacterium]|nr:flagellar biosynthesis protein FlhB [Sedimentisphaerales bacterium]